MVEDGFNHMVEVEAEVNDLDQEAVVDEFATPHSPEENTIKIDPVDFHYDVANDTIVIYQGSRGDYDPLQNRST